MLDFKDYISFLSTNALLGLGQIPNPVTGQTEVNLGLVKFTLATLEMLQIKTHGNLTAEEDELIRATVSTIYETLEMAEGDEQ